VEFLQLLLRFGPCATSCGSSLGKGHPMSETCKDLSETCKDCGVDITPSTGKRGFRYKGRWEHYMVRDRVWKAAGMRDGFLCIGCLENRIGRRLTARDFTSAPINDPDDPWNTS